MMYKQKLQGKPVILFGRRVDNQDCRFQQGKLPLLVLKFPAVRLGRTGNLRMQGKRHSIRSLTPLQATGNVLAMHVHLKIPLYPLFTKKKGAGKLFSLFSVRRRRMSVSIDFFQRVTPGLNAGTSPFARSVRTFYSFCVYSAL